MKINLYLMRVDFLKKSTPLIFAIVLLFSVGTFAQSNWSLSGTIQMNNGKYIYDENITTYYLYAGIRYSSDDWSFYASIPFIAQNSNIATFSGNMLIPNGHSNDENINQNNFHRGGMMDGGMSSSHMSLGLGDLYLYSNYSILKNQHILPEFLITGQIKIPTGNTQQNFGTGKLDLGTGIVLRKYIDTYLTFLDVTYYYLGEPGNVNYTNPFSWGLGLGKFIDNGKYSVSLYYSNYSKILSEFDGQKQISLAFYHRLNASQLMSISIAKGFSESSPDFSISGGIEFNI